MSKQLQWSLLALALLISIGSFTLPAKADVTGDFTIHISMTPQTTTSEFSSINFDVENELNAMLLISGLATTLHSHFGIAGIEDVILLISTTLGVLDVESMLVLGRFAFDSITPFYPALHFIKKKVIASIVMGGVTFSTTAQYEDTAVFVSQSSAYAFGDVLKLEGQTPSGVNIAAEIGICMEPLPNRIKKHSQLSPYSVNPECAMTPKPDILFDFETVVISGVPLAPNIIGSSTVTCVTSGACLFSANVTVSGGIVPFSVVVTFTDLLALTMGNTTITIFQGPGTLSLVLLPNGTIGSINIAISATLNADSNSASLSMSGTVAPGVGLTSGTARITIQRSGLTVGATANFGSGPPAVFQSVTFSFTAAVSILEIDTSATFSSTGLTKAVVNVTVNF